MRDAIVIGCGIIGATVSEVLKRKGLDVLTLDDGRPMSGTAPSGGHLKPSWFGGMPKESYIPAMETLDAVWGLKSEDFKIRPIGKKTTVYRVDTDKVIVYPRHVAKVTAITQLGNYPRVTFDGEEELCRLLIVATGVWGAELLTSCEITSKQGVSFRIPFKLSEPFIKPWAPYKQVVAHQQSTTEIWVGDGSAIIPQNWGSGRTDECLLRCQKAIGKIVQPLRVIEGLRAYVKVDRSAPCLFKRLGPRAYLATGAGKSGTIAAGWVANEVLKCLS